MKTFTDAERLDFLLQGDIFLSKTTYQGPEPGTTYCAMQIVDGIEQVDILSSSHSDPRAAIDDAITRKRSTP